MKPPAAVARASQARAPQARWLAASLSLVFAVKLAVLLQLGGHPLLQPSAAGGLDSQYYLQLAQRVAAGDLLLGPGLYFVSPLYIYFLAALLAVGGGSLFVVKVVQIALGTAGCGLVWLCAREWFSERAAWFALALAALAGVFTFYEILILQAALDPFLTAADLWLLTLALRRPARRWSVAAGAALGVHVLNRPNLLLVGAALTVLFLLRAGARRRGLLLILGVAIALLPLMLRNYVAAGTMSPTPSHGGLNLYVGNNPQADGTYHSVEGITPNIAGQAEDARRVAEKAQGRPLTDTQVSSYFTRRAVAWWRDDPGAASRLFVRKLAYTLNGAWLTLNYSYPFYRDESSALQVLMVGPVLLVPLGLLGMFAHRLAGRPAPEGFWIWAAFVPLTVVSVALFFVASRYRVPLLVALCVSSGGLLDAFWRQLRARRVPVMAVTAAALVPLAVLASYDFGLENGRGEEEAQMALAMIDRQDWAEATKYIARAETNHPDPAALQLRIGEALAQANRPGDAATHLERARALGAQTARSTYDLAAAYSHDGKFDDAFRVLTTIPIEQLRDPAGVGAVADLFNQVGLGLAATGKYETAIEAFQGAVRLVPAKAPAHLNLAVAYAESGHLREARDEALRALELDPSYQRAKDLLAALGRP